MSNDRKNGFHDATDDKSTRYIHSKDTVDFTPDVDNLCYPSSQDFENLHDTRDLKSYSDDNLDFAESVVHAPSHKPEKSRENNSFFKVAFISLVLFLSIMLSRYVISGISDMLGINREESKVVIEIPKDASVRKISAILKDRGVIFDASFFYLYATVRGGANRFLSGTFEIGTNMDYEAIVNYLNSNANRLERDIVDVTIPEGKNVIEIAAVLEKHEICSSVDFENACKSLDLKESFKFLEAIPEDSSVIYKLEGYLFPDTYKFYKNIKPAVVLTKFLSNYEKKVNAKVSADGSETRTSIADRAKKSGMSMHDLINIASIVQAEAANESDMFSVSSVIFNRLATAKNGGISMFKESKMDYLCMDCTVWYPYRVKEKVPADVLKNYTFPYDTYSHPQLPIGPICNPGMNAIEAAFFPKNTQYYYYCHGKDGRSYYAKTLAEHTTNLKKAGLSIPTT